MWPLPSKQCFRYDVHKDQYIYFGCQANSNGHDSLLLLPVLPSVLQMIIQDVIVLSYALKKMPVIWLIESVCGTSECQIPSGLIRPTVSIVQLFLFFFIHLLYFLPSPRSDHVQCFCHALSKAFAFNVDNFCPICGIQWWRFFSCFFSTKRTASMQAKLCFFFFLELLYVSQSSLVRYVR